VVIQVHPSHADALRANASLLDLSSTAELQVIGNARLPLGGCLIETEMGMVDARLETQLHLVERALTRRPA